jgi:hypothetical protein
MKKCRDLDVVPLASGQAQTPVADKSAQLASSPTTSAASSDASKYVGAETRKTCHEEIYNSLGEDTALHVSELSDTQKSPAV